MVIFNEGLGVKSIQYKIETKNPHSPNYKFTKLDGHINSCSALKVLGLFHVQTILPLTYDTSFRVYVLIHSPKDI